VLVDHGEEDMGKPLLLDFWNSIGLDEGKRYMTIKDPTWTLDVFSMVPYLMNPENIYEYFKIFYIHFLWMNDWSQRPKMEFSKTALDQILEPVDAVVTVHFCLKGARI